MPTVQIGDQKKYGKAIGFLLAMGGIFLAPSRCAS
jgi:hypothetical protein